MNSRLKSLRFLTVVMALSVSMPVGADFMDGLLGIKDKLLGRLSLVCDLNSQKRQQLWLHLDFPPNARYNIVLKIREVVPLGRIQTGLFFPEIITIRKSEGDNRPIDMSSNFTDVRIDDNDIKLLYKQEFTSEIIAIQIDRYTGSLNVGRSGFKVGKCKQGYLKTKKGLF